MTLTKRVLAMILAALLALGAIAALAEQQNATVSIDKKQFPDAKFRAYVKKEFDANGDGKLSAAEIRDAWMIELDHKAVKNLKGIECFKNLQVLYCIGTKLQSLDLTANKSLNMLDCSGNASLSSLKLPANNALAELKCSGTKLSSVDIGNNAYLEKIITGQLYGAADGVMCFGVDDGMEVVVADIKTALKSGSTVLRKYGKPKAIALSKTALTVKVGDAVSPKNNDIRITLNPENAVYPIRWTSSNSRVLKWDGGANAFTALEAGTATLTATCGGKKAKLTVTVE